MLKFTKCAFVILVALGLVWGDGAAYAAGRNRVGTAAAPELLIPVGARDMALGGSSIASSSGIEALHWNPAGMARGKADASVMFSTMSYIADINVNYLAVAGRFRNLGMLAVSLKALDVGDVPITTESQPDGTGGTFTPTYLTLGLSLARNLTDRIYLGTTLHYIAEDVGRVDGTAISFSAGLQYLDLGNIEGLDLGVAVKHIGQRMQYGGPGLLERATASSSRSGSSFYDVQASSSDLPSTFEIGLAYEYPVAEMGTLSASSVFQHQNYSYDSYRVGVEYNHDNFLYLRGGFDYAAEADDDTYLFGTSAGLGVQFDVGQVRGMRLDYAYTTVDHFDALNTFTFQVGF
ncbi:MAG: PorV/PorQ family protein [Gemmatimonadota bacterium]